MPILEKILSRITTLYYIFIVVLIADFAYSFLLGFFEGYSSNQELINEISPTLTVVYFVSKLLCLALYVWTVVVYVQLLISLWRSVRTKNIFNPSNIKYINRYALLYGISSIMICAEQLLNPAGGMAVTEMIINLLSTATTIVLLLLFAQVLKIGDILKSEQDLTI